MAIERPLDALNKAKEKRVLIELTEEAGSQRFVGKLKAFDIHINTILYDAVELDEEDNKKRKLGKVFIRGNTVALVSPQ